MDETQVNKTDDNPQSSFLPESLKDAVALQKFPAENINQFVEALGKGYISLEKELGNRAKIPDFNTANEEELGKFYSRIGRPEKIEDYAIDGLEDADSFKNIAFKAGLNNKQASEVASLFKGKKFIDAENFSQEGANKLADTVFGERKVEVLKKVDSVLKNTLSEEEINSLNSLDNNAVIAVYKAIDKLYNIQEGKIIPPAGGQMTGADMKPNYTQYAKDLAELNRRPHSEQEVDALKIKNNIK